jgi:hypothetical protein
MAVDVEILDCPRMSIAALGPTLVDPQYVFGVSDGFEVARVAAGAIPASVVDVVAFGYPAAREDPRPDVGPAHLAAHHYWHVAKEIRLVGMEPATVRTG